MRFLPDNDTDDYTMAIVMINEEEREISVINNWTDYLYIINNSDKKWMIKDKDGRTALDERTLGIVRFQQVKK